MENPKPKLTREVMLRGIVFSCDIAMQQDKDLQQFLHSFDAGSHKKETALRFIHKFLKSHNLNVEETKFVVDMLTRNHNDFNDR